MSLRSTTGVVGNTDLSNPTKMLKFLVAVLTVSLAIGAFAEDAVSTTSPERPATWNAIRYTFLGDLLDAACKVKAVLSDRELSDRIHQVTDKLSTFLPKTLQCAKPIFFGALNNKTSVIGRIVNILRMGNQGEITRLSDLVTSIPFIPLFILGGFDYIVNQMGETRGLQQEVEGFYKQVLNTCGVEETIEGFRALIGKLAETLDKVFIREGSNNQ